MRPFLCRTVLDYALIDDLGLQIRFNASQSCGVEREAARMPVPDRAGCHPLSATTDPMVEPVVADTGRGHGPRPRNKTAPSSARAAAVVVS